MHAQATLLATAALLALVGGAASASQSPIAPWTLTYEVDAGDPAVVRAALDPRSHAHPVLSPVAPTDATIDRESWNTSGSPTFTLHAAREAEGPWVVGFDAASGEPPNWCCAYLWTLPDGSVTDARPLATKMTVGLQVDAAPAPNGVVLTFRSSGDPEALRWTERGVALDESRVRDMARPRNGTVLLQATIELGANESLRLRGEHEANLRFAAPAEIGYASMGVRAELSCFELDVVATVPPQTRIGSCMGTAPLPSRGVPSLAPVLVLGALATLARAHRTRGR